jgi:hypothetical protein
MLFDGTVVGIRAKANMFLMKIASLDQAWPLREARFTVQKPLIDVLACFE